METSENFHFPNEITDPEKIIEHLSDEQFNALSDFIGRGAAKYYQDMMKELNRVEEELSHAKTIIKQDRQVISNLMQRFPLVKLTGGIKFDSGLN